MIFGIGTDLVDIARMDAAYLRHGERFLARVLGPDERAQLPDGPLAARWLAKRWAAKEAFAKALGTGIRPPVTLAGIQVDHDAAGRPLLRLDAAIAAHMQQLGAGRMHLSLSDEREQALAFVLIEVAS